MYEAERLIAINAALRRRLQDVRGKKTLMDI